MRVVVPFTTFSIIIEPRWRGLTKANSVTPLTATDASCWAGNCRIITRGGCAGVFDNPIFEFSQKIVYRANTVRRRTIYGAGSSRARVNEGVITICFVNFIAIILIEIKGYAIQPAAGVIFLDDPDSAAVGDADSCIARTVFL